MTIPEKIKVVRIVDGEVEEMYPTPGYKGILLWRKLNKDGSKPGNRYPDGRLDDSPAPSSWAHVDEIRETKANAIRARIDALEEQILDLERELMDLYATKEEVSA